MVEPMMQSHLSMTSTPLSNTVTTLSSSSSSSPSTMYYTTYPSTFGNVVSSSSPSVTSSPSMDESWRYSSSTDLLTDSTYNHPFSTPLQQPQSQQYMLQQDESAYLTSTSLEQQFASSSTSYDPIPSFQVSSNSYYHQNNNISRPMYPGPIDTSSSPQTPITAPVTSPSSSSSSTSHRSSTRKRVQSSPLHYSKQGRSPVSSPSSSGDLHQQRHSHYISKPNRPVSIGSLSPLSEQGSTTGSTMSYSPMNMISSFPTKVNVSTGASPKRYECHVCSKKFTRPSSLTTHIYSHTGEKPFQCPVEGCGRHFSVVSNLRRHAKIHTNPVNSKS
ncbi:uncharacterized protein BX664DRAFT_326226 [Halteromyces radiatus]|uniref:uncharacterized protein n=1 Tax=Halteromyces radiatus TaxID=101107 RepID=UPI002220AC47|nr:uncharacterized protein BX664DRAFT_326226 [Halteromyces radiatus]KAI8097374.1 hypothetical protein BX664DRAFT_326226 [Halteromyces radiatus]